MKYPSTYAITVKNICRLLTQHIIKSAIGGLFFIFLLSISATGLKAQSPKTNAYEPPAKLNDMWHLKEKFKYSVRYGCFNIGTISLEMMGDTMYNGETCHCIKAIIKSNPNLPFIGNRERIYYSLMSKNDTIPYTVLYWTDNVDGHQPNEDIYRMNYRERKVFTYHKLQPGDTLPLSQPSICGPVSLYYTRLYAGTNKRVSIPIYIDQKKSEIRMDNKREIQDIKCDAFKGGSIKTYVSHGQANFNGPFGFNGIFTVWYTTDSLRIPVAANLRVWLGNVKVRSINYEK